MFICADIGGTSARLEFFNEEGIRTRSAPLFKRTYSTESVNSFLDLFRNFIVETGHAATLRGVVCGIPGDVIKNRVEPINIPHWGVVDGNDLVEHRLTEACIVLNDFECAGFALNGLCPIDLCLLRGGRDVIGGVKVMVGVGTGLGVTFATTKNGVYFPSPSEAGWMSFSPISQIDADLVSFLKLRNGWKSLGFEQVCSGRALTCLYEFVVRRNGQAYVAKSPSEICYEFNSCPNSTLALQMVLEYLGRFLSQMAIIFKPMGGIYLCGGLMESLYDIIKSGDASFYKGLDSQPAPILSDIASGAPVFYISAADVGLTGAMECCRSLIDNILH